MATDSSGTDALTQILPYLLICCMLPMLMRNDSGSNVGSTEMDIWFTGYSTQEAYDFVVKATDDAREKVVAEASAKKTRLPSISFRRGQPKGRLAVDQTIPPNIYRLTDKDYGPMYFEFSDADGGGTQVKATFGLRSKSTVQEIKAQMPTRKLMVTAKSTSYCPSCGKPKLAEWQICPYCGTKLS